MLSVALASAGPHNTALGDLRGTMALFSLLTLHRWNSFELPLHLYTHVCPSGFSKPKDTWRHASLSSTAAGPRLWAATCTSDGWKCVFTASPIRTNTITHFIGGLRRQQCGIKPAFFWHFFITLYCWTHTKTQLCRMRVVKSDSNKWKWSAVSTLWLKVTLSAVFSSQQHINWILVVIKLDQFAGFRCDFEHFLSEKLQACHLAVFEGNYFLLAVSRAGKLDNESFNRSKSSDQLTSWLDWQTPN